LALAGVSSGATQYWSGPVQPDAPGEWNADNWGGILPSLGADIQRLYASTGGLASAKITTSGVAKAGKLQNNGGATSTLTCLLIDVGADLENNGSYEAYNVGSVVDVKGTWNACTSTNGTTGTFKLGGKNPAVVVNVWGTLNVVSGNSTYKTKLAMGNTYTGGGGLINIYDGGLVTADTIGWSGTTNNIKIYDSGELRVAGGWAMWQVLKANIAKLYGDDVSGGVQLNYDADTQTTSVIVPEPATIALLGAGSLMLLRRKR